MNPGERSRSFAVDWERCHRTHALQLTLWVRMHLGPKLLRKSDAEDLVQEAFLQAFEKRHQFRGQTEEEFLGWMRAILFSRMDQLIRRYGPGSGRDVTLDQPLAVDSSASVPNQHSLISPDTSPSMRVHKLELEVRLAQAISRLPELQREVLIQYHFEGRTFSQIADNLGGRTPDALKKTWQRTLPILREFIGDDA